MLPSLRDVGALAAIALPSGVVQSLHHARDPDSAASGDDTEDRRSANIELPLNSVVESATGAISEGRAGADSLLRLPGNSATAGSVAGWSGSV